MISYVLRYLLLDSVLLLEVDLACVFISCRTRRQIEFPEIKKGVVISIQQAPSDVLAEDAAIFDLVEKMLLQPCAKLVVPGVRTDANNSVRAMSEFTIFKQNINSVLRNLAFGIREAECR